MRFLLIPLVLLALAGCGSNSSGPAVKATNVDTAIPQTSPLATPPPIPTEPDHTPVATSSVAQTHSPTAIPARDFNSVVYGTVVDAKNKSPIAGATVLISGTKHQAKTNAFGRYTLKYPSRMMLAVTVTAPGYAGSLAMGQTRKEQRLHVDFKLSRAVPGKPVQPQPPFTFGQTP